MNKVGKLQKNHENIRNNLRIFLYKIEFQDMIKEEILRYFLDGYFLINKLRTNCVYGQASAFLKHARGDYQDLHEFITAQIQGLELATNYFKVR